MQTIYGLLRRGLLAMPPKGPMLSFNAPLVISEEELDDAFSILADTLNDVTKAEPKTCVLRKQLPNSGREKRQTESALLEPWVWR